MEEMFLSQVFYLFFGFKMIVDLKLEFINLNWVQLNGLLNFPPIGLISPIRQNWNFHQKMGDKECFASVTIGKDYKPEVLKLNGLKMKSTISVEQQVIESHNIEVNHEILDDIDLDVLDTVHRYACEFRLICF